MPVSTPIDATDEQFALELKRSKGGRYLLLTSSQTSTSDVRFVDAAKPDAAWASIRPRAKGVRYFADEVGGTFYIRTNLDAPDYRIVAAKPAGNGASKPGRLGVTTSRRASRARSLSHSRCVSGTP